MRFQDVSQACTEGQTVRIKKRLISDGQISQERARARRRLAPAGAQRKARLEQNIVERTVVRDAHLSVFLLFSFTPSSAHELNDTPGPLPFNGLGILVVRSALVPIQRRRTPDWGWWQVGLDCRSRTLVPGPRANS